MPTKIAFTTGPIELDREIKNGAEVAIIDVREEEDYKKGHIPCAVNLPHDRWDTFQGLRKDAPNIIYCYSQVCHLAAKAAVEFAGKGYSVMEMDGGFKAWKAHDLEIEQVTASRTGKKEPALAV